MNRLYLEDGTSVKSEGYEEIGRMVKEFLEMIRLAAPRDTAILS